MHGKYCLVSFKNRQWEEIPEMGNAIFQRIKRELTNMNQIISFVFSVPPSDAHISLTRMSWNDSKN